MCRGAADEPELVREPLAVVAEIHRAGRIQLRPRRLQRLGVAVEEQVDEPFEVRGLRDIHRRVGGAGTAAGALPGLRAGGARRVASETYLARGTAGVVTSS